MTTRNFRVNNGLEVGDIVISASANTITGGATAAPSSDGDFANKKYVDDQATATLVLTNKTLTSPVINSPTLNGTITSTQVTTNSIVSNGSNADITLDPTGTGDINLTAGADVNIPANIGLTFGDDAEKIEGDGTDLTITGNNIKLTPTADTVLAVNTGLVLDGSGDEKIESDGTDISISVGSNGDINIPANIGLTFGDDGEKIEGDGTDLTISGNNINLTATADVIIPTNVGLHFTDANEKIESNGTDLTLNSGADINLTATADINVPSGVGITFGDDAEKIEGDGTDLTISGNNINLTAVADVNIPSGVGLTFATAEKIESDGTDLTITVGSNGDINVGADIGITFGDDGEKIEGDGTDLTISSSNLLNLSATTDVVIPTNVGLHFTDANEKIESNGTDLTINAGADINLTATADVNIPADVGITFGDDGEKIEGNGTNLTIASSGTCTITATNETVVTNNLRVGGNLTVDGTETIVNTTTLSVEDNIIEVNRNVSANSGMPTVSGLQINRGEGSTSTEMPLLWAWDESFADDGTTIHGNAGGAFTAFRRAEGNTEGPSGTASLVDIRANVVHALSTSAQYADVAERFEADAPMSAGAVVEVGGDAEITETTTDLSENVFGVISEQPAYAMNAAAGNSETHPFVAMTGRTPVRVTGAVSKGQRLVTSSVKGCARAVATGESISPFNVIGRALESSDDTGIKLVNCAVRTNN